MNNINIRSLPMNQRAFDALPMEQRSAILEQDDVKSFLTQLRSMKGQTRAITGSELLVPEVGLELLRDTDFGAKADGTYYVVTDTYTSFYKYNMFTESDRLENYYARDLLRDFIVEGGWGGIPQTITLAQANAIGQALGENESTAGAYQLTGVVTAVENTTYGNLYIADEAGNTFYIYGLYDATGRIRYDGMENPPKVGDTITLAENPADEPFEGFKDALPVVFSGIYPADGAKYQDLREALEKLKLNDASFAYELESSIALGFGFRCGFLGLLHMEIIQERIEREFQIDIITTAPSVIYRVTKTDGSVLMIDNPTNYPDAGSIMMTEEPFVKADILTPKEFIGNIMELCQDRRGIYTNTSYLDADRVTLHYELPLGEIIYDFFDTLKSRTRGYASLDYELADYRESKLVKLDIMLNGDIVDALSFIVHTDKAYSRARRIAEKLKEHIPRQLFEVPVQACIGGKIIARETVKAMRKDVLAKCYGGDITRKKKLLEKQKEGKKRMRQLGSVEVPQEAFMAVLKLDS